MKILIWNDETVLPELGKPKPVYNINIDSGSVIEIRDDNGKEIFYIEVG